MKVWEVLEVGACTPSSSSSMRSAAGLPSSSTTAAAPGGMGNLRHAFHRHYEDDMELCSVPQRTRWRGRPSHSSLLFRPRSFPFSYNELHFDSPRSLLWYSTGELLVGGYGICGIYLPVSAWSSRTLARSMVLKSPGFTWTIPIDKATHAPPART